MNNLNQNIFNLAEVDRFKKESIDIYEFYNVLYKLFEDLGILTSEHEEKDKIAFRLGRPEDLYQNSLNLVTMELGERSIRTINDRKQTQHRLVSSGYNPVNGQIEETYIVSYVNEVLITVTTEKQDQLFRLIEYLEDVFIKHKGRLEQNVVTLEYLKTTGTHYYTNNASTKMQSKTIVLIVYTQKTYTRLKEQIQQIK